jgi:hypothetical protein
MEEVVRVLLRVTASVGISYYNASYRNHRKSKEEIQVC